MSCNCPSDVGNTHAAPCSNACVKKPRTKMCGAGISTAIVDDANQVTYLYGNILFEDFHQPEEECQPYLAIPTDLRTYKSLDLKTEVFEGEFADNAIQLAKVPTRCRHILVFLNGVHQDEGQEYDYQLNGKAISFNFHTLVATDRVTVKYWYEKVGA